MKRIRDRVRALLSKPNAGKLLFFLGMAGILLIFLSEYFPQKTETKTTEADACTVYGEYLRQELEEIVSSISGAGKTQVFITLEASGEYLYAYDEKKTSEKKSDSSQTEEKLQEETAYTTTADGNGGEQPLTIARLTPAVRGVLVTAEGADDVIIRAEIQKAVAAALGIPESKIYVTKRK